jgi:hypothetical protein
MSHITIDQEAQPGPPSGQAASPRAPRMSLHREDASVVAHELEKSAGRAYSAGFYATGQKLQRMAERFRQHAAMGGC